MGARAVVETGRDRRELVADAGYGGVSFISAVAGVLSSYGMFALLAGIAAGVLASTDINVSSNWRELGMGGGLVVAGLLFLAYLFGGYVAGRMARRAGALHGVVVFVLGVVVVAVAAFLARQLGGADVAESNLRGLGVPTTGAEWGDIATVAGIASLAGMLLGAVAGGVLGERWHGKLVRRALDPNFGAEAEARHEAEVLAAEAEERRTGSYERRTSAFRRVRAATPSRTRRSDDLDATVTSQRVVTPREPVTSDDDEHTGHTQQNWAVWREYPRDARETDGDGVPNGNGRDRARRP